MKREYESKIKSIVQFYENELKELLKQFSISRIEFVRVNTLLGKIVSLNYSQETWISEIMTCLRLGKEKEATDTVVNNEIYGLTDMVSHNSLTEHGYNERMEFNDHKVTSFVQAYEMSLMNQGRARTNRYKSNNLRLDIQDLTIPDIIDKIKIVGAPEVTRPGEIHREESDDEFTNFK